MVYFGMAYDPVLFTYNGCAFCPDCEPEDAPREEVGACFEASDAHGSTCEGCGACFVAWDGWLPRDEAVGAGVVWTCCDACNAQKPYARDTYLADRKAIKARCTDCGRGKVARLRRKAGSA